MMQCMPLLVLNFKFVKGHCVTLDKVERAVISSLKYVTIITTFVARDQEAKPTAFFS